MELALYTLGDNLLPKKMNLGNDSRKKVVEMIEMFAS